MAVVQIDDQGFISRLQAGDEAAVETLMTRYATRVFGLALRMTGNRQDAEEVLQDVFWTVVQKIGTFRGEAKLSSWIYRITTNASLMKLRKRPKIQAIPLEEELGPAMTEEGALAKPVVDWTRLPPDEVDRKELLQRIGQAIDLLPQEYRSALVLRDIEGLSAHEACEVLQLSVPALKSRLHRARLFLRKQLTDVVTARHARTTPAPDPGGRPAGSGRLSAEETSG